MQLIISLYLRHATIAILTAALCFPAPAQNTAPVATPNAPAAQTVAGEKVLLQLAPLQAPFVLQLGVHQKASMTGKQKMTMEMKTQLDFRFEPLAVEPSAPGRIPIRLTVVNARFSRKTSDGPPVEYDSKNPPKQVPEAAETIALLHGMAFDTEFDATGRIQTVRNIDEVTDLMLERMKIPADQRKNLRSMMKGVLGDAAFKNFNNVLASFPTGPVSVGDQWRKVDPVSSNDPLIYDTLCTLAGRQNGISTISVKSAVIPDPQRKNRGPVYQPQGSQVGSFDVEEMNGQTKRAVLRQYLTAYMDQFGQFVAKLKTSSKMYLNSTFTVETSAVE